MRVAVRTAGIWANQLRPPCAARSSASTASQHHTFSVSEHTVVAEVPGLDLPDGRSPLRLHLITAACPLYFARDDADLPFPSPPWWAFVWPGGYGQSRFVLHLPEALAGKRVLDFGCGCGVAAVCAKATGSPSYVAALDIDPVACAATELNAALNGVKLDDVICEDIIGRPRDRLGFDLIMLGDMCYDEGLATLLLPWLSQLRRDGMDILLCDPGRRYFPRPDGAAPAAAPAAPLTRDLRTQLLETYPLPPEVGDAGTGISEVMVARLLA